MNDCRGLPSFWVPGLNRRGRLDRRAYCEGNNLLMAGERPSSAVN